MVNIGSYPRQGGSNIGPHQREAVVVAEAHMMAVTLPALFDTNPFGTFDIDFISAGFGAVKGCVVMFSNAHTNESDLNHARMSVGYSDLTNHKCVSVVSQNGQNTTVCKSSAGSAHTGILILNDGSGIKATLGAALPITDGVRIRQSGAFPGQGGSNAKPITVVLLGGTEMDLAVGEITSHATSGSTVTIGSLAFQPEQAMFASCQVAPIATPAANAHARMCLGFWDDDGAHIQGSWNWHERDAEDATATGTKLAALASDSYVMHGFTSTEGSAGAVEVTAVASTSLTLTTRVDSVANELIYLLLRTSGGSGGTHFMVQVDAPTTPAAQQISTLSAQPRGMLQVSCRFNGTFDSIITGATTNAAGLGVFGPSIPVGPLGNQTGEASVGISSEDAANPASNTYSIASDDGIYLGNVAASDYMHASILNDLGAGSGEGWQTNGWIADWGNVLTNANHVWYWGFGDPSASTNHAAKGRTSSYADEHGIAVVAHPLLGRTDTQSVQQGIAVVAHALLGRTDTQSVQQGVAVVAHALLGRTDAQTTVQASGVVAHALKARDASRADLSGVAAVAHALVGQTFSWAEIQGVAVVAHALLGRTDTWTDAYGGMVVSAILVTGVHRTGRVTLGGGFLGRVAVFAETANDDILGGVSLGGGFLGRVAASSETANDEILGAVSLGGGTLGHIIGPGVSAPEP